MNPMFLRIPLFNPDSLVSSLLPFLGWTLSSFAVGAWAVICLFGASQVFVNFDRFGSSFSQILSVDNWLYLFFVWLGLKIIHELYHGLICKKYGGHVPRCGIMLIMFSPKRSRRRRQQRTRRKSRQRPCKFAATWNGIAMTT